MIRKFLIISIASALIGCDTRNSFFQGLAGVDFSNINQMETAFSDLVLSYKIVPLEYNERSIVADIRKIIYRRGKFFIRQNALMSGGKISIFDSSGTFLSEINAIGRGPSEYVAISDFDVHPQKDLVTIIDPGTKELIDYSFDGTYLANRISNCWIKRLCYFNSISEGVCLLMDTETSKNCAGNDYGVFLVDRNLNIKNMYFPFESANSVAMGNGSNFYPLGNDLIGYYRAGTNAIYNLKDNGELTLRYRIKFPKQILPSGKIMGLLKNEVPVDKYTYLINYFENASHLVMTFWVNKRLYVGIFVKKNGRSSIVEVPLDPSCRCTTKLNLVGVAENSFIFQTDVFNIAETMDLIDCNNNKLKNRSIIQEISRFSDNSNPILLLVNFK